MVMAAHTGTTLAMIHRIFVVALDAQRPLGRIAEWIGQRVRSGLHTVLIEKFDARVPAHAAGRTGRMGTMAGHAGDTAG